MRERMVRSPEFVYALRETGVALEKLGVALQGLAAAAGGVTSRAGGKRTHPLVDPSLAQIARSLATRLGEGNREFLAAAAMQFEPGEHFSLDELASAAGVSVRTARARLMNIGRSLKSLGARGLLWETTWDEDARQVIYEWTYDGHEAVLQELVS